MKSKKIIAAILIPAFLQFANFSVTSADTIDDEFALFAAEQGNGDNNSNRLNNKPQKPKTKKELKEEQKRLKKERKEEKERLEEERKEARKAIKEGKKAGKKNKVEQPPRRTNSHIPTLSDFEQITEGEKMTDTDTGSSVTLPTPVQPSEPPKDEKPEIPQTQPETNNLQNEVIAPEQNQPTEIKPFENKPVGLPNPMVEYSNFNELVRAVHFNPLYVPKKSGYTISKMFAIDNRIAEIRYKRRWEPEVSLDVRTYKRDPGENLKDISGIHGVQWRIDLTSGTSIYIAKVSDTEHAAAWAVGQYTFSAVAKNLSYAAFHSLVTEELADLSTHYYIS